MVRERANVRFAAKTEEYERGLRRAQTKTDAFFARMEALNARGHKTLLRRAQRDIGALKKVAVAAAPLAGIAAASARYFAKFEAALTAVSKVAKVFGAELQGIGTDIREMAKRTGFAAEELLQITRASAQLGIKGREDLVRYTEVVAKMGVATNLAGEEAAFALARISAVTGEPARNVQNLASSIVTLGNNFAALENEIADFTITMAAATASYGVASHEAAALGTAFAATGQQAMATGTATGKVMAFMNKAVLEGGDALETFARLTGTTEEGFKSLFEDSAARAFAAFIEGLSKTGKHMDTWLAKVGLTDIRTSKSLKALTRNSGALTRALDLSNDAFQEGTALQREYEIFIKSLEQRFLRTMRSVEDLAIAIGARLAPGLEKALNAFKAFLDEDTKGLADSILTFAKLAARVVAFYVAMKTASLVFTGLALLFTKSTGIVLGFASAIRGVTGAMAAAKLAAKAMWSAILPGIGLLVAFFPEILDFFGVKWPSLWWQLKTRGEAVLTALSLGFHQLKAAGVAALEAIGLASEGALAQANNEVDALREKMDELNETLRRGYSKEDLQRAFSPHIKGTAEIDTSPVEGGTIDGGTVELETEDKDRDKRIARLRDELELAKMRLQGIEDMEVAFEERRRQRAREKLDALEIEDEEERQLALAKIAAEDQLDQETYEKRKEIAAERREEELELAQEEYEQDLEALQMRQQGFDDADIQWHAKGQKLKSERRKIFEKIRKIEDKKDKEWMSAKDLHEYEQLKIHLRRKDIALKQYEDMTEKRRLDYEKRERDKTFAHLEEIFGETSTVGKAIYLFRKAFEISDLIARIPADAYRAWAMTYRNYGGSPQGDAPAAAAMARSKAAGYLGVAATAAATFKTLTAEKGGMVPGVTYLGDVQPALLTAGETIVPPKNYADLVAGILARHGAQQPGEDEEPMQLEVDARVDLTDDAAKLVEVSLERAEVLGT